MVAYDDSYVEDESDVDSVVECVGKSEKCHAKPIVGVWSFRYGRKVGLITIAHDSAKLWILKEDRQRKNACFVEDRTLAKWRHAVQSCDVSSDGKYALVISLDSIVHEVFLENEVTHETRDFGYMEALHASISVNKNTYITSSYSGNLSEIEVGSNSFFRREPFTNFKNISCLTYSTDMKYVAIGHSDGVIELFETSTLKLYHKYEVHSMKVRKIVFLPGEERFLTACDDKLVKMLSLKNLNLIETNRTSKAIRIFSAHNSAVLSLAIDERSGGTRFASGSTQQIFIWHVEISTPISFVPADHKNLVTGLSFSPSGRHLFSVGDDSSICCYRVPASGESSPFPEDEEPESQEYFAQPRYDAVEESEMSHEQSEGQHFADESAEGTRFYDESYAEPSESYNTETQYGEQNYQANHPYHQYEQENEYAQQSEGVIYGDDDQNQENIDDNEFQS